MTPIPYELRRLMIEVGAAFYENRNNLIIPTNNETSDDLLLVGSIRA